MPVFDKDMSLNCTLSPKNNISRPEKVRRQAKNGVLAKVFELILSDIAKTYIAHVDYRSAGFDIFAGFELSSEWAGL